MRFKRYIQENKDQVQIVYGDFEMAGTRKVWSIATMDNQLIRGKKSGYSGLGKVLAFKSKEAATKKAKQMGYMVSEAKGSYLDNKKLPKEGQSVYALVGFDRKVVKGKVKKISNIDQKGLANTYLDLDVNGKNYHVDISQIYDHKPKQVKTQDAYGEVTIWEATQKLTKQVQDWLKLKPDTILFNQRNITSYNFDADILIDMIKGKNDTITITKHTLEGNIGIQLYKKGNTIKVDTI